MFKLKNLTILTLALSSLLIAFSGSHATTSNGGYTAAPGDGVCTQCHTSNNTSLDGEYTVTGIPSIIESNTTYNVEIQLTNPSGNAARGGFQILALDESNTQGGTWSNESTGSSFKVRAGKTYLGHQGNQTFPASNELNWSADWTSPDEDGATFSFYAVSILGNGASGNQNDRFLLQQFDAVIPQVVAPLSLSVTVVKDATCANSSDGSATVTITGGEAPYTILWENGETSETATMLPVGNTAVKVTDATGMEATEQSMITSNDTTPPSIILKDLVVYATENGFEEITAEMFDFGTTDNCSSVTFSYVNSPLIDCESLGAQIVSIIASDISDNTDTMEVMLSLLDTIPPLITDGQLDIVELDGCEPFIFELPEFADNCSAVVSIELLSGFESGEVFPVGSTIQVYSITDLSGNEINYSFTVNVTSDLTATVGFENANCNGESSGEIFVQTSGTHAPFLQDSSLINNGLSEGSYLVTIMDTVGCQVIEIINISEPSALTTEINTTPATDENSTDGNITVTVEGGNAPYTIRLFEGATTVDVNDSGIFNNLPFGVYNILVMDDNGCSDSVGDIAVSFATSTSDLFESYNVEVFPNPVKDQLTISIKETPNLLSFSIRTIEGKIVWSDSKSSGISVINLSNQASGLYLLSISDQKTTTTRKISIQH